jgi:GT2 family glycosyltransferase
LWTLYRAIEGDERVGAIGPQVLYGDGTRQSTRRRFPSPLTGFFESTWLGQLWPQNPWARRYHIDDWPDSVRQDVDWVVGAALMVRGSALEAVGGFDDDFFMYSEELDLCKRIKKAGWRVVYDPAAIVIHYEGRSSGQVSTRRHILFNRSKVRYYRKYFGPIWAEVLRQFLLMEFRWQIAVESLKAAIGHKRDLRRARIAAYRQVVESGLRRIP